MQNSKYLQAFVPIPNDAGVNFIKHGVGDNLETLISCHASTLIISRRVKNKYQKREGQELLIIPNFDNKLYQSSKPRASPKIRIKFKFEKPTTGQEHQQRKTRLPWPGPAER